MTLTLLKNNQRNNNLRKETTNESSNKINIENIKKILLRELKIAHKDIEGHSKKPEITKARHIYAYLLRNFTELSTVEIGKIIGGKPIQQYFIQ